MLQPDLYLVDASIWPKKTAQLLSRFESLENLLANIPLIPQIPIRSASGLQSTLSEHVDMLRLYRCRWIIEIHCDIPLLQVDLDKV